MRFAVAGFLRIKTYFPLHEEGNFHVLVGDGVKQSKEERCMFGVKKFFQESEKSVKSEYIYGHMFGELGILVGNTKNWVCILLSIRLHDGLQEACGWKGASVPLCPVYSKWWGMFTVPMLKMLNVLIYNDTVHPKIVAKVKKFSFHLNELLASRKEQF